MPPPGDFPNSSPLSDDEGVQEEKDSLQRSLAISASASACSSCGGSISAGVGCPRGLEASIYLGLSGIGKGWVMKGVRRSGDQDRSKRGLLLFWILVLSS